MFEEFGIFSYFGAIYPHNYDAMIVDIKFFKEIIPFDQVKVPVHMIHGDADYDINVKQAE